MISSTWGLPHLTDCFPRVLIPKFAVEEHSSYFAEGVSMSFVGELPRMIAEVKTRRQVGPQGQSLRRWKRP